MAYTCCSVTEANLNYTDLINHLNKLATSEGILAHSTNNKLTYWLKRPKL